MEVNRAAFVELVYGELEPELAEFALAHDGHGVTVLVRGVAGGTRPGIHVTVTGAGEVGYFWQQGSVYRSAGDGVGDRAASLDEARGLVQEVRRLLQAVGRDPDATDLPPG